MVCWRVPSGNGGRKIGGLFLEGLPEGPLFELRLSGQKRRPVQACERLQHGAGITVQGLPLRVSEPEPLYCSPASSVRVWHLLPVCYLRMNRCRAFREVPKYHDYCHQLETTYPRGQLCEGLKAGRHLVCSWTERLPWAWS